MTPQAKPQQKAPNILTAYINMGLIFQLFFIKTTAKKAENKNIAYPKELIHINFE